MYTINRHQLILNPAIYRARLGTAMVRSAAGADKYHRAAVADAVDHIFSINAYEDTPDDPRGATPLERRHGIPNFLDI